MLNVHCTHECIAHYDLQNTKVSLISLFPLFKFNICQAPVLNSNQKSLVTYKILVLHYVHIYWLCDNDFLHMCLQFCLVQKYAAKGHLGVWLWRSRYWQSKRLSTDNMLEFVYFSFISHLCLFCTVHAHTQC